MSDDDVWSVRLPSEVEVILNNMFMEKDNENNFLFPTKNDGITILLAVKNLQLQWEEAKKNPKKRLKFQMKFLKDVQRFQRNKKLPLDIRKMRYKVVDN